MYEKTYIKGVNMKRVFFAVAVGFLVSGLIGCFSLGGPQFSQSSRTSQPQVQPQQQSEDQSEKFLRLYRADVEKFGLLLDEKDNLTTITERKKAIEETLEAAFSSQVISGINEITGAKLSDPGRPYYFKLQAIYKGYDTSAERARLQDLGQKQSNVMDSAIGAAFGVDSDVYSVDVMGNAVISTFPTEANAIATFYLVAVHFTESEGKQINETGIYIRFVHNIEPSPFDPAKFIVVDGMHYITIEDAHSPTQNDVMTAYFFGGAAGNPTSSVFDPVIYPLVDLMEARVAMDKKDIRNDYTFPTVKIRYVSEVVFKGQLNTTITVSTNDNVLTERMSFTGRASTIKNGDKIRVYYTIAKDPLEKWEMQAIERL
jgi:hypothetical protein